MTIHGQAFTMNTNHDGVYRTIKLPANLEKILVRTEENQWKTYDNLLVTVTSPRPFRHTPSQLRALSRMVEKFDEENTDISSVPRASHWRQ